MAGVLLPFLLFLSFIVGFFTRQTFPSPRQEFALVSPTLSPAPLPTLPTRLHTVTYVLDGDTIVIDTGEHVRYLGIDAPEKNEAYGVIATRYNEQAVLNKQVRLEFDKETVDVYGRLLAYVWVDATLVNEYLLDEGYATVSTFPGSKTLRHYDRFAKAQEWAREHHHGMWIEEWRK